MKLDEGRKHFPRAVGWLGRVIGTAGMIITLLTIPAGIGAVAATVWLLFRTGWRLVFSVEGFLP